MMRANSTIRLLLATTLTATVAACGGVDRPSGEAAAPRPASETAAQPAPPAAATAPGVPAAPASASAGAGAAPTATGGERAGGTAPAAASPPSAASPAPGASSPTQPAASTSPGDAAQGPGATEILTRASSAYEKVRTLQADFVQQLKNPLLGDSHTSRGRMLQRRPDRFLMRFTEPAGDLIVSDGSYFWVYYPSVDPKQVIRMPAAAAGGGVDLQSQFLGDPVRRFTTTLDGRERVAGHDAYVLTMVPRSGDAGYSKLRVWIDPTDYLARRFELTEENGNVRRIDLSGLKTNAPVSGDAFRFTPPADAHVVERG